MGWCEMVDVEPFLVFNLGTQGVESACQMVEYCNGKAGSSFADLRRAHGREAPYEVRLWGLGNEMDGDWQVGARVRRGVRLARLPGGPSRQARG